jgi:AcrR family transcriptional regulator
MNPLSDKTDARWARTRQRLLDGGREAFAQRGVEAATVLEIVRAAGVSQPSFYNHFATKDALALEIAADYFRRDQQAKQAVFAAVKDPAEAIAINIRQTLDIAITDPVVAWVLVRSETLRDLLISSEHDPLADMIRSGVAQERFCIDDAQITALVIRSAALGVVQSVLKKAAGQNATECFQELVLRMLGLSPDECRAVVQRARLYPQQELTSVA